VNLRLSIAVVLLLPSAAFAQGNPGPFGGLFGRAPERIGKAYRVFEIRTSSSAQYEQAVLDDSLPRGSVLESGAIASLNVGGMFEERSTRFHLRLQSSGTYQQYLHAGSVGGTTVQTGATINARVATRLSLDGSVNHLYTPFFQFHRRYPTFNVAGVLVEPSSPYVATVVANNSYEAIGGFTSYYSKHSTLSASFSRRETRFTQLRDERMSINGMRSLWTRQLNRDFRFKLGYGRERVHHSSTPADSFLHEVIDLGVDFERPLSLSRSTTLAFTTETSMFRRPGEDRHYRLNGRVLLNSRLRRTWQVSLSATRLTEFMPGFVEPLFSDNVGASVTGLFSRRVEAIFTGTAGRGVFGIDAAGPRGGHFMLANGTTQLNVAVTRRLGLFVQHGFHFFELPPGASTIAPLDRLTRHTYVVGITAWIPLLTQERDARDSR